MHSLQKYYEYGSIWWLTCSFNKIQPLCILRGHFISHFISYNLQMEWYFYLWIYLHFTHTQWLSLGTEGSLVRDSKEALCCVLTLGKTLYPLLILVQPRRTGKCPDMTEKLSSTQAKNSYPENRIPQKVASQMDLYCLSTHHFNP